jgi:hypothetical protein
VIAGATRPGQVVENAAVSGLDPLPASLHQKLSAFYQSTIRPEIGVPI